MDIISKVKIELSVADTEELLKKALVEMLNDKYSMPLGNKDLRISFKATTAHDQMDRGPGTPTFSGAIVEIIPIKHDNQIYK